MNISRDLLLKHTFSSHGLNTLRALRLYGIIHDLVGECLAQISRQVTSKRKNSSLLYVFEKVRKG